MAEDTLIGQLRALETQLAVLRAQMKHSPPVAPGKRLADLEGIFAGKAVSAEDDIEAAQYRFAWEGTEEK